MGCDQTTCITPCLIRSFSGSHSISQSPSLSSSHPEISVFLQLLPLFPAAPFYCSLHVRKTVSEDGPWEWSDGARRLSLAKQGTQAFVYASAPLVAKSSLKTRHKEAAEEPDTPPTRLSSTTCHDSPRLAASVSASRAAWPRSPARATAAAGADRLPFVCLIIQRKTWREIRAHTDYALPCSCSWKSLQVVSVPRRIHLRCGSQTS